MKLRDLLRLLCCVLIAHSALAQAQGVYVTQGENGPVFSDKPQPGAKEVTLKPLNVVPLSKEPKVASPASTDIKEEPEKSDAAVPGYQGFAVLYPENYGSIVANTMTNQIPPPIAPKRTSVG